MNERRIPRHALDAPLTAQPPGEQVRAEMAAFYKTNHRYVQQQHSHGAAYFQRLLGVMNAVLANRDVRILEIGAGSAGALRAFLSANPRAAAVALEMSVSSVAGADGAERLPLHAIAGNALCLPFKDKSFDAVIAFEVIEHLPDVGAALEEALRVVRRPGHVIIGLPNHASLFTPIEDRLRRRSRLAFGVDRGRGAWRWWKRNAALALRKRRSRDAQFLYREPILHAAAGGDADAVYYAAPVDLMRFFKKRRAAVVASSAELTLGWAGRLLPVELQGSTVMAWQVTDAT